MRAAPAQPVCEKCNGEGAYVVREPERVVGDFVTNGLSTVPCSCREGEPPRQGKA